MAKKIAIDVRRIGDFGVGTYIRNLINTLGRLDRETRYILIGSAEKLKALDPLPGNFHIVNFLRKGNTVRGLIEFRKIVKRLDCEGKPLEIAGTNMATGQPFNAQQFAGKPVIVFYWASWSQTLAEDAKKLKELAATYGPKGLEIISIALDDEAKAAGDSIQRLGIPGTHLHMGGLDRSPLATSYGIIVVPHLFVVGKDGKIVKRNGEMTTLEDDVKKLTTP